MSDIQYGNYIRLYRKITNWEWYSDGNTMRVFLHLLLTANWKDGRYRGFEIPRGSTVIGRKALAKTLKISEQEVRTSLFHLQSTNEITMKSTNKFTIVTLVNYDNYQVFANESNQQNNQQSNQQLTNNQPTTNHTRINKESNNENNENIEDADSKRAYGVRGNVYLTQDELEEMQRLYPNKWRDMIEHMSFYKSSSGKRYANDFDTMMMWEWDKKNETTQEDELDFLNTDWHFWTHEQWSKAKHAGKVTDDDFRKVRKEVLKNGTV